MHFIPSNHWKRHEFIGRRKKFFYLLFCPQDTLFLTRNRFLLSPENEKQQNKTKEKDTYPCNSSETTKIETKQIRTLFKLSQWVRKRFTYLVGIIETVIHKSGNQWCLSHCKTKWKIKWLLSKHYISLNKSWHKDHNFTKGIYASLSKPIHFPWMQKEKIQSITQLNLFHACPSIRWHWHANIIFHKVIPKA